MNQGIAGSSPANVKGIVGIFFAFDSLKVKIYSCHSEGPGSIICWLVITAQLVERWTLFVFCQIFIGCWFKYCLRMNFGRLVL